MTTIAPIDDRTIKANNILFPNLFATQVSISGSLVMVFTTGLTIQYTAYRIGDIICLSIKSGSCVLGPINSQIPSQSPVPTNIRPSSPSIPTVLVSGLINGVAQNIGFSMTSGGILTMFDSQVASGNFSGFGTTISWKETQLIYLAI